MSSSVFSRLHGVFSKSPKQISSATTTTSSSATTTSSAVTTFHSTTTTNSAATLAALFSPTTTSTTKQATPKSPNSPNPKTQALVSKFIHNSRFPRFRRNHHYYKAVVSRLASDRNYSSIETIPEYQKKYYNMGDEGFGARLIGLYGRAGMFDHACKVFDEFPKYNCPRTVKSLNALLSACVNSKRLDRVNEIFLDLPQKLGIQRDVFSYNIVIKGLCDSNDLDSAMKVVGRMEESVICPDTVMEACYKEDKLAEAEKLWQRMEEKGVRASVFTYNSKVRSLIRNEQIGAALELLEKMGNEGVQPDTHTYNAVIKGCVRNGNLEEAKILHGKMVGDGCPPDYLTYQMLLSCACEQGEIDFALQVCMQAVKFKVYIHRSLMQLVVNELIKRAKIEEANELVAMASSCNKHQYTLTLPVTPV